MTGLIDFIRRLLLEIDYNNRHQRGSNPGPARNENARKGRRK